MLFITFRRHLRRHQPRNFPCRRAFQADRGLPLRWRRKPAARRSGRRGRRCGRGRRRCKLGIDGKLTSPVEVGHRGLCALGEREEAGGHRQKKLVILGYSLQKGADSTHVLSKDLDGWPGDCGEESAGSFIVHVESAVKPVESTCHSRGRRCIANPFAV